MHILLAIFIFGTIILIFNEYDERKMQESLNEKLDKFFNKFK